MRIGEAAETLGVSRDTLRRLERRGVLTPRRDWVGQRRYTNEDLDRLREVLFANPDQSEDSSGDA